MSRGVAWPVNVESARHVRRVDNPRLKSLWECICIQKGWLDPDSKDFQGIDVCVLLTVDEIVAIELFFQTGIRAEMPEVERV